MHQISDSGQILGQQLSTWWNIICVAFMINNLFNVLNYQSTVNISVSYIVQLTCS